MEPIKDIFTKLDCMAKIVLETDKTGQYKSCCDQFGSMVQEIRNLLENVAGEIISLQNEVARLESRLNNNSHNCGATTAVERASCTTNRQAADEDPENTEDGESADNGKAPNEYNGRDDQARKTEEAGIPKKPVGGQPGHAGTTLTEENVKQLISVLQEKGIQPDITQIGDPSAANYKDRYVIGIKVLPFVRIIRCYENADGTYNLPEGLDSVVSYDTGIHTLINYLRNVCNMADGKIASFISDITEGLVHPSVGTVANSLKYFSEACAASIDTIIEDLLKADVAYTDATYTFKNGENAYIRNISTKNRVLYIPMDSKSLDALNKVAVLPEYHGILIHDHEIVMYHFGQEHGECIIHVMRYCRKDIEDTGNEFAAELIKLFEDINKQKKEKIASGIYSFTEEELEAFSKKYDEIITSGREENKSTKHAFAQKREATFLNRLEKYKENHLLFMYDFNVDWCNNVSELDLRKAKRHTAVTGGFRTDNGIKYYCNSLSVIESMKKEGMDLWTNIRWIIENKASVFLRNDINIAA